MTPVNIPRLGFPITVLKEETPQFKFIPPKRAHYYIIFGTNKYFESSIGEANPFLVTQITPSSVKLKMKIIFYGLLSAPSDERALIENRYSHRPRSHKNSIRSDALLPRCRQQQRLHHHHISYSSSSPPCTLNVQVHIQSTLHHLQDGINSGAAPPTCNQSKSNFCQLPLYQHGRKRSFPSASSTKLNPQVNIKAISLKRVQEYSQSAASMKMTQVRNKNSRGWGRQRPSTTNQKTAMMTERTIRSEKPYPGGADVGRGVWWWLLL